MTSGYSHRTRTLWLSGVLHGFTHLYSVALLPLYLLIQEDLHVASVAQVTFLITVMMLSYVLPSYSMGVLADRMSRKKLLGFGLALNATGFVALSMAPNFAGCLVCVAVAGLGGSFYHPAATALVARLYPTNTGRALGFVGMGASVGFFIGPIYAGWRAAHAGWRTPVLELGIAGLIAAAAFMWLAEETSTGSAVPGRVHPQRTEKMFPSVAAWGFFLAAGLFLSLRDFTGSAMGSLGSLFLQKAHGLDPRATGLALSGIFLASVVSNPLFGHLSDRARMRYTGMVLGAAALVVALFPYVPKGWEFALFMVYGFFFLASYPMVEAALMLAVPDAVRGRVFGLFITMGGLVGNLGHWLSGVWVRDLGPAATRPEGFREIYLRLSLLVIASLCALPCLHALRKREEIERVPVGAALAPSQSS